MTILFDFKYRKLVKKLHYLIFETQGSPAIYATEGVPEEIFLRYAMQEPMRNILWGKNRKKDGENLKKIRSDITICVEKKFIRKERENLKIGYDGERLISCLFYFDRINFSDVIAFVALVVAIIALVKS